MLRAIALAIAIAGVADPVITRERRVVPALTIAGVATPSALDSADRLLAALSDAFDVRIALAPAASPASACPPGDRCVILAGRSTPPRLLSDGSTLAGVVRTGVGQAGDVAIAQIDAPARQSLHAVGQLRVLLTARDVRGSSEVELLDAGAVIGSATVSWEMTLSERRGSDSMERAADIDFWPIAAGTRRLTVRASPAEGEQNLANNRADIAMSVESEPAPVFVYDPRPAWSSTFVRRALEGDRRFRVRVRSRLGPDVAVSAGAGLRLDSTALDDAHVAIVGAPDQLTAAEVDLLDRYVRVRGGSLVLLPDRGLQGASARLAGVPIRERIERPGVLMGTLRASELLIFSALPPAARTIVTAPDGSAVVVALPQGSGRVIVSGAMDAWRHRTAAFDNFWRALVADAATAAGRAFDLGAHPPVVRPGETVRVDVIRRTISTTRQPTSMGAEVTCGNGEATPIRLWPSGDQRFEGVFTPVVEGECDVRAFTSGAGVHERVGAIVVAADVERISDPATRSAPERLTRAFDVPMVTAGEEPALATELRAHAPAQRAVVPVQLMRSPWWIVPFALCLGGEWWLRRRRGQR
jgi:hypothetical protein